MNELKTPKKYDGVMRIDLLKKWLKMFPYGYCDGMNYATCRANEGDCPYCKSGVDCSDGEAAKSYYREILRFQRLKPKKAAKIAVGFAECLPSILRSLDTEIERMEAKVEAVEACSCPNCGRELKPQEAAKQLAAVTAERDALKERTRWVPVSERLPDMCGFKCLACAKNKFEQTQVFTAFTGYMEHWKLEFHSCEPPYDDLSAWEITHWMPLPEAPKEAANG